MTKWTKYDKLKLYKLASQYKQVPWKEIVDAFANDPKSHNFKRSQLHAYWHKALEHKPPKDYEEKEIYIDFDRELVKNADEHPDRYYLPPNAIEVIYKDFSDKKRITKYDIADIHAEAAGVFRNLFEKKIEQAYHNEWHVTAIGDFYDNSHKFKNKKEKKLSKNKMSIWYYNILKRLAHKGLLDLIMRGNHDKWDAEAEWDHVEQLADFLKVPYAPTQAFVHYKVGNENYVFLQTHGWGGGRKSGSKLNKVIDLAGQNENVDGIITAHHHDPTAKKIGKKFYDPEKKEYYIRHIQLVILPAWIQSADYSLERGMAPQAMEDYRLHLYGEKKYIKCEPASMWDFDE